MNPPCSTVTVTAQGRCNLSPRIPLTLPFRHHLSNYLRQLLPHLTHPLSIPHSHLLSPLLHHLLNHPHHHLPQCNLLSLPVTVHHHYVPCCYSHLPLSALSVLSPTDRPAHLRPQPSLMSPPEQPDQCPTVHQSTSHASLQDQCLLTMPQLSVMNHICPCPTMQPTG